MAVSLLEAKLWSKFCHIIGREDLIYSDETAAHRHSDHGDRAIHYRNATRDYCISRTRNEISSEMGDANIPICPILTPEEAIHSQNVLERGLIEVVDHPKEGRILQLSNLLTRAGLTDTHRQPAPELGEHTFEIFRELGYSLSVA